MSIVPASMLRFFFGPDWDDGIREEKVTDGEPRELERLDVGDRER